MAVSPSRSWTGYRNAAGGICGCCPGACSPARRGATQVRTRSSAHARSVPCLHGCIFKGHSTRHRDATDRPPRSARIRLSARVHRPALGSGRTPARSIPELPDPMNLIFARGAFSKFWSKAQRGKPQKRSTPQICVWYNLNQSPYLEIVRSLTVT